MTAIRRPFAYRAWPACLLLACLVSCETVIGTAVRPPAEGAAFLRHLKQAFPELLYHGAALDGETGYLIISLRVHPGRLAARSAATSGALDLVLVRLIVDGLYDPQLAAHLAANRHIEGVTVLITWEGCRRVLEPDGGERILMADGVSEYDRFDVNRQLYFRKINWTALGLDPVDTGKLFDNIVFSHAAYDGYEDEPFHRQENTP